MSQSNQKATIILIIFGIFFALSPSFMTSFRFVTENSEKSSEYSNNFTLEKNNLKTSIVSEPIYIDDTNPSSCWPVAKAAGICTGTGISSDPYLIEYRSINGENSDSCIEIRNSDVYFIIRNCILYNAQIQWLVAGISLRNVTNSQILNNNCSYNNGDGIVLYKSYNNLIIGNSGSNCEDGLYLYQSNYNILSENTVNNNNANGMFIEDSDHTVISGNMAFYNNYKGIRLFDSKNNIVSGNIANNNYEDNMALYTSYNNKISENTIHDSSGEGILVWRSNNNTISGNNVYDSNYNGIFLCKSNNNVVSGTTLYDNYNGIALLESNHSIISGNLVNHNRNVGIQVDLSFFNKIYVNCFENILNAYDGGVYNEWDNGIMGNFWSDYAYLDENDDGIGDYPYDIAGPAGSQDNFPLMTCQISAPQGIPIELIILILVMGGEAVIGVVTLLLIRRKRKIIE